MIPEKPEMPKIRLENGDGGKPAEISYCHTCGREAETVFAFGGDALDHLALRMAAGEKGDKSVAMVRQEWQENLSGDLRDTTTSIYVSCEACANRAGVPRLHPARVGDEIEVFVLLDIEFAHRY